MRSRNNLDYQCKEVKGFGGIISSRQPGVFTTPDTLDLIVPGRSIKAFANGIGKLTNGVRLGQEVAAFQ